MFCACAQSIAGLGPLFAPLPANVAAMGNVSAGAGAQSALGAALAANSALAAATSASAVASATVSFDATAMASLTALANGLGALQSALKLPLTGSKCGSSITQLTNALSGQGLMKALGGLPMGALSPLKALAQLAGAIAAAKSLGVALLSSGASAQPSSRKVPASCTSAPAHSTASRIRP